LQNVVTIVVTKGFSVVFELRDIDVSPCFSLAPRGRTSRSPVLPDVPTIVETVPGFQMAPWIGFVAPKATPAAIVERPNRTITEILNRPAIKATWTKQGAAPYHDAARI